MDIDELEMNDLYNEKKEITQNRLPGLLYTQTQLTNNINDINKLQQIFVEELIDLETKGYHGNDETTYALQYYSGHLYGVSNKPLKKAMRFIPAGATRPQPPPLPINPTMTRVDVRCRERWVHNKLRNIQIRKEQFIERLEQVRTEQTKYIKDLCKITIKIQNKEDPEDQEDEEDPEDQEDEEYQSDEDEDEEDQSDEDEDEEDQSKENQDEMHCDEENIDDN